MTIASRVVVAFAACLWAGVATPGSVLGDDQLLQDAPAPAAQESLVQQAVSAYAAGDLALSRRLFEEAHFAEPTARTLRGLGVLAFREGRFAEAIWWLEASLDAKEKALTPELRSGVVQLLAQSRAAVAQVLLTLAPGEAEVKNAGEPVPRDHAGALLFLPGQLELRVSAPGHATRHVPLVVAAGDKLALSVSLPALTEPAPPPRLKRTDRDVERGKAPSRPVRLRRAAYGLLAVSAAALISSTVSGGLGLARRHDIEDHCRDNDDARCDRAEVDQLVDDKRLDMLAALSTVSAVAAGVSAGAGATLWLLARRSGRPDGVRDAAFVFGVRAHF